MLDEDAKKPEDWDDDMDGEWEPPLKTNPEYKGEWAPKKIRNPAYMVCLNLLLKSNRLLHHKIYKEENQ